MNETCLAKGVYLILFFLFLTSFFWALFSTTQNKCISINNLRVNKNNDTNNNEQ